MYAEYCRLLKNIEKNGDRKKEQSQGWIHLWNCISWRFLCFIDLALDAACQTHTLYYILK